MTTDLTALRKNYDRAALDEKNISQNPIDLFTQWLEAALAEDVPEPYAMTLATCGKDMQPSARTLLLRGFSEAGFLFYTNYGSDKGRQLAENPHAEMLFFWHSQEQQVRVAGTVEKLDEATSTAYFHKRPHESQVGAWVSQPQSGVVASRAVMEEQFAALLAQHPTGTLVPKPPQWGGYRLIPSRFEFWQGRPNRVHDRLLFQKNHEQAWQISRLMP